MVQCYYFCRFYGIGVWRFVVDVLITVVESACMSWWPRAHAECSLWLLFDVYLLNMRSCEIKIFIGMLLVIIISILTDNLYALGAPINFCLSEILTYHCLCIKIF